MPKSFATVAVGCYMSPTQRERLEAAFKASGLGELIAEMTPAEFIRAYEQEHAAR